MKTTYKVNQDKRKELIKEGRRVSGYNKSIKIKLYNLLMVLIGILWVVTTIEVFRLCYVSLNKVSAMVSIVVVAEVFRVFMSFPYTAKDNLKESLLDMWDGRCEETLSLCDDRLIWKYESCYGFVNYEYEMQYSDISSVTYNNDLVRYAKSYTWPKRRGYVWFIGYCTLS